MSELEPQCKPEDTEASDVDIKGNGLSVKVALLDDGCKLETLEGKQEGQSFHHDQEEFFVGPCSHGTEMARCIREVCPKAELYIARLDNSHKYENQKFTIASCCKVSLLYKAGRHKYARVIDQIANYALVIGSPMGDRYGGGRHIYELVI